MHLEGKMEHVDLRSLFERFTPEYLSDTIMRLAASQREDNQDSVSITPLINALIEGHEFAPGREGWQSYLSLKQMIRDTLLQIPGMRYVEGDS
jgi:hypothetical protein